ncbi:MAG: serine protease [Bdellovibrionales bacterium]|nr:serine protease [Bdellovibrionales bacterium]
MMNSIRKIFLLKKKTLPWILFAVLPIRPFVIYGEKDNRTLLEKDQLIQLNQSGIYPFAMITKDKITPSTLPTFGNNPKSQVQISSDTLVDRWNLCKNESYLDVPAPSDCSGFAITENKISLANHCLKDLPEESDCNSLSKVWVLNLNAEDYLSAHKTLLISTEQVFHCQRIIERNSKLDYAIIELDHAIKDFVPPRFANFNEQNPDPLTIPLNSTTELSMVGFPLGLPSTLTNDGHILKNSSDQTENIESDLDAFSINSGSVVFESKTKIILGMLIAGSSDSGAVIQPGGTLCNRIRRIVPSKNSFEVLLRIDKIIK